MRTVEENNALIFDNVIVLVLSILWWMVFPGYIKYVALITGGAACWSLLSGLANIALRRGWTGR